MARAYDFWTSAQKENFHPDGKMTQEYREWLIANGTSLFETFAMEARKQKEVKDFEETEQRYLREFGETFSEMTARRSQNLSPAAQKKRQQLALDEGAELSELPYDLEPDEYYDHYADYPG
ncbi:MAG: phosphoribosyl-ATP pyrophosphatase [Microcystaceae cyanobacterium]